MAKITKEKFGTMSDSSQIYLYTLENSSGARAKVINYGARLQSFIVPDKDGNMTDILLGLEDAAAYENDTSSLGAIVGRHANRIKDGQFTINGTTYQLEQNNGKNKTNSLHSGHSGFHYHLWSAMEKDGALKLVYMSPDGDGGFPGNLQVTVTYSLSDANELSIHYEMLSDADTICNMTNHSYFNLNGCNGSSIENHTVTILADSLTEADADSLPNGTIYKAEGTPMDLRQPTRIGDHIDDDFQQLNWAGGYDHNWILSGPVENGLRKAAVVQSPDTGITLTVHTTLPGMQFYTGNGLKGAIGKNGVSYGRRSGLCLETQFYPNSPANPSFPQPLLKAGVPFSSTTVFTVGIAK